LNEVDRKENWYLKHQKTSEEFSSYKEKIMKAIYLSEQGRGGFDAESK